jgi:hypothetical protein
MYYWIGCFVIRNGSEIDHERMQKVFAEMEFQVIKRTDLSAKEMISFVEEGKLNSWTCFWKLTFKKRYNPLWSFFLLDYLHFRCHLSDARKDLIIIGQKNFFFSFLLLWGSAANCSMDKLR